MKKTTIRIETAVWIAIRRLQEAGQIQSIQQAVDISLKAFVNKPANKKIIERWNNGSHDNQKF